MGVRTMLVAGVGCSLCLWAELLPIRSYSTADGLAANRVDRIVVDSRGFVWRCTPEGLSRFGKAKAAYQDFLAIWSNADSDIPTLKLAKAEYSGFKNH